MDSDTILAISAGITLLLAIAAFSAIWQNHSLQKRERRERLLNEIIEWAEDLAGCSFLEETQEGCTTASNLFKRYRYLASRKTYIKKTVSFFKNEKLSNALSRILNNKGSLINVVDCLNDLHNIYFELESKNKITESETDRDKLAILSLELGKLSISAASKWMDLTPISQKLYEDVTDLIENASNIKIKLIS